MKAINLHLAWYRGHRLKRWLASHAVFFTANSYELSANLFGFVLWIGISFKMPLAD